MASRSIADIIWALICAIVQFIYIFVSGNFRGEQRFVPRGPGGPGAGTLGPGLVDARNHLRQHETRMVA